jgi:hypothetical protein
MREVLRRRLVLSTPVFSAHERALMAQFEATLAAAVALDLGDPPDGVRPRMVAAAATAALLSTESYHHEEGGVDPATAEAESLALLDDALTFLRGGIDALQRTRSGGARE